MSQVKIGLTRNIKYPNEYVKALSGKYKDWVLNEELAPLQKGQWFKLFFNQKKAIQEKGLTSSRVGENQNENKATQEKGGLAQKDVAIDLEIGTGTGTHFTKLCLEHPKRNFLALEIKYKPLIQTIRRARKHHLSNMRGIRYNAKAIADLFEKHEIDNIYLHFPDPWLKKRVQKKHRLIQADFCELLFQIQKPSSFLDFKTDSLEYFESSLIDFQKAGYKLKKVNRDLYSKEIPVNIDQLSQFEQIFVKKRHPIKQALFSTS